MRPLTKAWYAAARGKRKVDRRRDPDWWGRRPDVVREHAAGRSFADIGAMWRIHGATAFLAEESGATRVTAFDVMGATPEFEAERERRGSQVRFVEGDLHDRALLEEQVGTHDTVWCSGVIYHSPHPIQIIDNLAAITGSTLLLGTQSIPEVPGVPQACVFFPKLDEGSRMVFASPYDKPHEVVGVGTEFDDRPLQRYANWWWGLTPSSVCGMLEACGFDVVSTSQPDAFFLDVVARRREAVAS